MVFSCDEWRRAYAPPKKLHLKVHADSQHGPAGYSGRQEAVLPFSASEKFGATTPQLDRGQIDEFLYNCRGRTV